MTTTTPHPDQQQESPPATPPRKRWRWPLLALAVALVAAGVLGTLALVTAGSGPDTITVRGTLTLNDPDAGFGVYTSECAGSGGYDDIQPGAQVTITGPDGTVLAVGEMSAGTVSVALDACRFWFQVAGVPAGHGLYGIEVAHRGVVTFPEERLNSVIDGPALSLG
jgi:hypothetical protein